MVRDPAPRVVRLLTEVDLDAQGALSFSALHLAVLDDGRRVTLLADRGWAVWGGAGAGSSGVTAEEIITNARMVVGPDEPSDGLSQQDMEREHWTALAGTLRRSGVVVDGDGLRRMPHDVKLSVRVRERLGLGSDGARSRAQVVLVHEPAEFATGCTMTTLRAQCGWVPAQAEAACRRLLMSAQASQVSSGTTPSRMR